MHPFRNIKDFLNQKYLLIQKSNTGKTMHNCYRLFWIIFFYLSIYLLFNYNEGVLIIFVKFQSDSLNIYIISFIKYMKKILLLLLLISLIISQQIEYDIGSRIEAICQPTVKSFYFKLLREFGLAKIYSTGNGQINFYNNNRACIITSTNSICIFNNMTKQVKMICNETQNITLQVFKPEIMTNESHVTSARFVEVHFTKELHGIVNLNLDSRLSYDLMTLRDQNQLNQLFVFTECFLMVDYFEDKIRFAVQKIDDYCVIGLKEHHDPRWSFSQGEQKLMIDNKSHKGYIHKIKERRYAFEKLTNILIQFSVQSENTLLLNEIQIKIEFFLQKASLQQFELQNFQKGIFPLRFTIFFNRSFDQIKLTSNKNLFYIINLDQTKSLPIIELNVDEYIYTHLNGELQFLIQFDNVQEQQFNKKKLYLLESYHQSLNISYSQCSDLYCLNKSQFKLLSDNYFIPECKVNLYNQCKIKIKIVGQSQKSIGLLPYIPENIITLELNKIHKGIIKHKRILIYEISKRILEIETKSEITIQAVGVKAFATYNNKCNRINCCEYPIFGNQLTLPKKNENLKIFLQGTKQNFYSLLVNTNREKQYTLNLNQFLYSFLKIREDRKYYIFQIKNQTNRIEINLNSPKGSLAMLVNVQKQEFAYDGSSQYYSSSGYLSILKQNLLNKKIYITLLRLQTEQKLDYSLLVIDDKPFIQMPWQKLFFTKVTEKYPKIFSLKLQKRQILAEQIGLKVDLQEMKQNEVLNIQLGNPKAFTKSVNITRLTTLKWKSQDLFSICNYTKENLCQINLRITAYTKSLTGIEILFWKSSEPFKLAQNKFMNFESGGLGQINQLYFDFRKDFRPLNIYIYSNEVLVRSALKLFFHNKQQKIFYNVFPRLNDDVKTNLKQKLKTNNFTSSASYYYRKQQLIFPSGKQFGTILITIRDLVNDLSKSHRNQLQAFVNGTIKIGISRGIMQFHDDDKFEYILLQSETQIFIYQLVTFLKTSSEKEQLYFFTTNIVGKSIISYQIRGNGGIIHSENNISQIVIINLKDMIDKKKYQNSTDLHIKFVVKNQNQLVGRYLSSITSTKLNFRQLLLGVPTEYFIRKNSGMTFLYVDLYSEDFKIKTDRKEGLPQYKIRSCKPQQDKLMCLKSLQMKGTQLMNDTYTLSGRSHQLEIHKKSQHYCKGCRYYIAFYAFQKDISGKILIVKKQSYIQLQQGKTFTSMVYSDQIDYYKIIPPQNVRIQISIIPHMSQISADAQIIQIQSKQEPKKIHLQNSFSIGFAINGSSNPRQINIKVKSIDNQNALYTIVFTASSKIIQLKDGVPLSFLMPQRSISHFQYLCEIDSNLLILSDTQLEISIMCQNQEIQKLQKGHMLNYKNTIKTIQYSLYHNTCQKFEIILENEEQSKYQVIINGLDILMLPFNTLISGKVGQNKHNTYEIIVQQKTYLKFVLRFCNIGIANLMIAEDKISLDKKQYEAVFDTSGTKGFFVFDYTASPGLLYFQVQSNLLEMEYSIQVFPYYSHNDLKYISTELSDPLIRYHQGQNLDNYNIMFNQITVNSKQKYNIQYYIVISNNKSSLLKYINCITGISYDKNQIIREYKIIPIRQMNKQLIFQFKVSLDHGYLTILPRFEPSLPSYTEIQKYQIIELYKGTGISILKKFFNFSIILLAQLTGVKDQIALNILFVLSVMFSNMLIICISCCIYARYCRSPLVVDRIAIPSNQRASRNIKISNSLDMIQRIENQSQEKILV